MDEVERHCQFEVLATDGEGVVFDEAGVEVVILEESLPDDDDAVVGDPAEVALLLADLGLIEAEEGEFLFYFLGEGEAQFVHDLLMQFCPIM